ncbi:MAG: zf-HC2 domain-containing protein [Elusimicrobiota bacterium]|jgi:anti-sigma factor RsiW
MNSVHEGSLISAYVDGELIGEERHLVEAHLGACASCRSLEERLRRMKWALAAVPRRKIPADLLASLQKLYSPRSGAWARLKSSLSLPRIWVPAGAAALAALMLGLWFGPVRSSQEIPLEPLLAAHARYRAESWVPNGDLLAAAFSRAVDSRSEEERD